VFSLFVVYISGNALPTPSPLPYTGTLNVGTFTKVIGQTSFTVDNDYDAETYSVGDDIYGMRVIPATQFSAKSGPFSSGGLIVGDTEYDRVLFYVNPIANFFANASFVFGTDVFDDSGDNNIIEDIRDISYDAGAIYIADYETSLIYSYDASYFTATSNSYVIYPNATFGQPASALENPWQGLDYVSGIAAHPTGYILAVDSDCDRVLYWSSEPATNAVPAGVIGARDINQCEDCYDSSDYPCLEDPEYITIDCHGGIWILTYDSTASDDDGAVYYFAPPSVGALSTITTANFGFTTPSPGVGSFHDAVNGFDSVRAIQFDLGTCSLLAIAADETLYIVRVGFAGTIAIATPEYVLAFGGSGGEDSDESPTSTTDSLEDITAIAWDISAPASYGYIWVADGDNERIVYFNTLATAPSSSVLPAASSVAVLASTSPTASLSHGASPSNSPSPLAPSSSPISGDGDGYDGTGNADGGESAGSRLNSWLF